ncbi:MAG TPA: signal recognition particle-docking protein FtsY [Rhodospirillales bacterium]|nr:signal recognition particle-docking protein FtsY [Rhodospirillales bacterium]
MSDGGKLGWAARLKQGLAKTSSKLGGAITDLLTKTELDDSALDDLQDVLISADLGVKSSARLAASLANHRFRKDGDPADVLAALAEEVERILDPIAVPFAIDGSNRPHVVLVCGVNGGGKTTSIGKLAKQLKSDGKSVMMVAADTFRAAAVEQLKIWGERTETPVIAAAPGADAAGLAYDALAKARAENIDVLLIDTAGRLQNKSDLMAELEKIVRVIKKIDATAPHDCLLVLDATVGQNAHSQVEIFQQTVQVSGLLLTKLDGSARGGVVVSLAEKFGLPVHAVGVGEGIDDMRPFEARAFARNLVGLT